MRLAQFLENTFHFLSPGNVGNISCERAGNSRASRDGLDQ